MKHGIKQRKLGRMPQHRIALLRNLVSALLHHESIKTTLPKAKEAAKMAEKVITYGKKGSAQSRSKAQAYLMPPHHAPASAYVHTRANPTPVLPPQDYPSTQSLDPENFKPPTSLFPKLFTTLAQRYADRPGGYTRIHKFGRRPGDNAPHAILTLVDGPRDLKFEMMAREIGKSGLSLLDQIGEDGLDGFGDEWEDLDEKTRRNVKKTLRYRSEKDKDVFKSKARAYMDTLISEADVQPIRHKSLVVAPSYRKPSLNHPQTGRRIMAGERLSGMNVAFSGLGLARGALDRPRYGKSPLDKVPKLWSAMARETGQGDVAAKEN